MNQLIFTNALLQNQLSWGLISSC